MMYLLVSPETISSEAADICQLVSFRRGGIIGGRVTVAHQNDQDIGAMSGNV